MDLNLDGKVAVVTGAGKGIGLAVTRALAAEGARVVAGSRATDSLDGIKGVSPVAVDELKRGSEHQLTVDLAVTAAHSILGGRRSGLNGGTCSPEVCSMIHGKLA